MWIASIKSDTPPHTRDSPTFRRIKADLERLGAQCFPLVMPNLRVGTLDALLTLSDELGKADATAEAVVAKVLRQLREITPAGEEAVVVNAVANTEVPLKTYVSTFDWDQATYPLSAPLKDLVARVSDKIGTIDDELKQKSAEFQAAKSQLAAVTRKEQGSLLVRSLGSVVPERMIVESEYLTTLLVVMPGYLAKEWMAMYESLSQWVVPGSSSKIADDKDYSLYSCVVFRKFADDVRTACRAHKFTVREYSKDAAQESGDEKSKLTEQLRQLEGQLVLFSRSAVSDAYAGWIHLKIIRTFVESVLRYGLPPAFTPVLILPNRKVENKHHDVLKNAMPATALSLGGTGFEDEAPGVTDFYPYVFLRVDIISK
jgi:V-type H+-transporting ATPase subunit C